MDRVTTIAPADRDDFGQVVQLLIACDLTAAGLEEHIDSLLVVRRRGEIVGCGALEVYGQKGLMRSIAIAPEARGAGLGSEITCAVLARARDLGVTEVFLLTETAWLFFPRFGFREIEREDVPGTVRASVEFDRQVCSEHAVVMAAKLENSDRRSG